MAYLADTNIVLRRVLPNDPLHALVRTATRLLDEEGETLHITAQNMVEFQALATRPVAANGLGMTPKHANIVAGSIEAISPLLPETSTIYTEWRTIMDTYAVIGRQVYDTRLVAVMRACGITHLLTLNPKHFRQFAGIVVVDPHDLVPASS